MCPPVVEIGEYVLSLGNTAFFQELRTAWENQTKMVVHNTLRPLGVAPDMVSSCFKAGFCLHRLPKLVKFMKQLRQALRRFSAKSAATRDIVMAGTMSLALTSQDGDIHFIHPAYPNLTTWDFSVLRLWHDPETIDSEMTLGTIRLRIPSGDVRRSFLSDYAFCKDLALDLNWSVEAFALDSSLTKDTSWDLRSVSVHRLNPLVRSSFWNAQGKHSECAEPPPLVVLEALEDQHEDAGGLEVPAEEESGAESDLEVHNDDWGIASLVAPEVDVAHGDIDQEVVVEEREIEVPSNGDVLPDADGPPPAAEPGSPRPAAEPLPPLPPPAAEPRVQEDRAGPGGWPTYEFPGPPGDRGNSTIKWSINQHGHIDIKATCGHCGRTRSRTTHAADLHRRSSMKSLGQGRPLGMIWAFLAHTGGEDCRLSGSAHRDWKPTYAQRVRARLDAELAIPTTSTLRTSERPPNVGVADGPEGEPLDIG